ncbi:MAG: hypothetical protein ACTSP3_02600 [Candidatus Heimdallarchaeaceae archaeon]
MSIQKRLDDYLKNFNSALNLEKLSGTFQLNKYKPIHRWYNYITGFSSDLVEIALIKNKLNEQSRIFEPFTGVGTSQLVSKQMNISSIGVDVNPFIIFVAKVKLNWDLDLNKLVQLKKRIEQSFRNIRFQEYNLKQDFNRTIKYAFSENIKKKLYILRDLINNIPEDNYKDFFMLGLVSIIREVSNYKSFQPYLKRMKDIKQDAQILPLFLKQIDMMIKDLKYVKRNYPFSPYTAVFCKDIRESTDFEKDSFDFIITSPPYLNNWDYSYITRLELYFLEYARTSQEIRNLFSDKLVRSSTYNIYNNRHNIIIKNSEIQNQIQTLFTKINSYIQENSKKKRYDLVIVDYFNDLYRIFKNIFDLLKDNATIWWVVGDSGHYGFHIPTDEITVKIAESLGFKHIETKILRTRKASRHNLVLKEVVIVLKK